MRVVYGGTFGQFQFQHVRGQQRFFQNAADQVRQLRLAKLHGRQVHGHREPLHAVGMPGLQLGESCAHHPLTDLQDLPAVLGDGNEFGR